MKVKLLKILLLSFLPLISFAQQKNGVYFEFSEKDCPYKKVKVVNEGRFVCIPERPVFDIRDYEKISKMEIDTQNNLRRFEITLTNKGREKLLTISKLFTGSNLAFVFENEVVCLFKLEEMAYSGKIIINEYLNNSAIEIPYQTIKENIEKKNRPNK
ncbi:hypothetical protein QYS48_06520 [Marivirga arenosa]|uniref:Uncharacterized protein n=1 Tax=Marivirga arenosa TaxID=3059076 RepID=A0AA49JB68_9BACT|nr:hypothetical protein [Marivirga sp. ABR2-2]WKK86576.1 hypothetical protein QYS48_06520 [Marivirga sp. ABR2-2]